MEEAVALIELGSSHDECLYAQIKFLQAYGIPVQLVVSDALFERRLDRQHGADRVEVFPAAPNRLAEWSLNARVIKFLKSTGIRYAVLNTAHGKGARTLCTLAPQSLELFGIAHNARRLLDWSVTQALISRKIKRYFVLSDYIIQCMQGARIGPRLSSFYPIYFPMKAEPVENDGRFWVGIPGKPEFKRRDYLGLIENLKRTKLDERVQFVLVGNATVADGPEIQRRVREAGLERHFVWFDRFVDYSMMLGYLSACRVVLPLLHQATKEFENYLRYQITGAFSLARAVQRPMLMHERFADRAEFRHGNAFYREDELADCINRLASGDVEMMRLSRAAADCDWLKFENQSRLYVRILRPELVRE